MQLLVSHSFPKVRWKGRAGAGFGLILLAVMWVGTNRLPANATRVTTWQGEQEHNSLSPKGFRIASFNIHGGEGPDGEENLARVADCFTEVRPDFVGLNEVHGGLFGNQAEDLGRLLNMASQFVPTERRFWQPSFGNALLSNVATAPVLKLPLPCTQGKKYRTAALTSFQVGGRTVRVLCVHLDRVKDREVQLNQVFSLFCGLESPAVLMGDLNTPINDPLLQHWLKTQPDIRDAVGEIVDPHSIPRRVDWILTRGLETVDAGYVENEASDHPLVWAEIKLPEECVLRNQ